MKTFSEVAQNWLTLHTIGIKAGTASDYKNKTNKLCLIFGNRNMKSIKYYELQEFINSLFNAGLSKSTIHKYIITISQVFKHALKIGIVSANPCFLVKMPKNAPTNIRTPLNPSQISLVINNINHAFGLYPFMMLFLGMRRSELVALCVEDINYDDQCINVSKVINYVHNQPIVTNCLKNGNKSRSIAIPDILHNRLLFMKNTSGYIFNNDGMPLLESQLRDCWEDYVESTGLQNVTQHMIRHTYATMLYQSEVDIKTAQYLMGHNDIRTILQIYTHLEAVQRAKNIDKFNTYISNRFIV